MRIVLVGRRHHIEALEQDWPFVRPAKTLTLDTVSIDEGKDFPLDELIDKGRNADAIGWWWNANRTETYLAQIKASLELEAVILESERPCHAFVTETHHRGVELEQIAPLFQKLFVPHLSTIPASDDDKFDWLPYGCPIGIREAENLLCKPLQPQFDIVYPFNHYFLGDRVQRLTKIIKLVRRLGLSFKAGSYNSSLEPGFAHARNYFNVLASGRTVLNLSVCKDLNQRLFEANLIGATCVSDRLPDHDKLDFDRSNSFFFNRDLSDFEEVITAAVAHQPALSPRADIRNRHLLIHRFAEFLSNLSGIPIKVMPYEGHLDAAALDDGKVEYRVQDGDTEYNDLALEIRAMQCCLYNRIENCLSADAAFAHLREIARLADESFDFEIVKPDVMFLIAPLVDPSEIVQIASVNKIYELRANVAEGMNRFKNASEFAMNLGRLIRQSDDLSILRSDCHQFLNS